MNDIKMASSAKLPVPTVTLFGIMGLQSVSSETIALWIGDAPSTPVGSLLQGWTVTNSTAQRGGETLTLAAESGRTWVTVQEPEPTSWQRAAIQQAGWPSPAASAPTEFTVSVDAAVASGSFESELSAFATALGRGAGTVSDTYGVSQAPPAQYETYGGPFPISNLTADECGSARPPTGLSVMTAADLVSGQIVQEPYWSALDANGISVGFAPGHVVIATEHAGIVQVEWYEEPAITVPPMS